MFIQYADFGDIICNTVKGDKLRTCQLSFLESVRRTQQQTCWVLAITRVGPGGLQGRIFEKARQPQVTPLQSWDLLQKPI